MSATQEAACTFALKETTTSQYAIACEPQARNLAILGDGRLMLKLRSGIPFGHAEQITRFLQQNVTALIYREANPDLKSQIEHR